LATWVTSLSINALGHEESQIDERCWEWLLSCQHKQRHPFTGADPGGWGWTDLSGAVPDADDTPGALLALALCGTPQRISAAVPLPVLQGINWLLKLQNRDRGWPTFCRGWGKLPFDRSGTDLTAHAIRALHTWFPPLQSLFSDKALFISRAIARGFEFLAAKQNPDGSWSPLWFGNQDHPDEDNPIYGTSKVLLAYRDTNRMAHAPAVRGLEWLARQQNADGSFGSVGCAVRTNPGLEMVRTADPTGSVEETALAVEGLLSCPDRDKYAAAVDRGLGWLVERVERDEHKESSPIGFYFAKLWYYEELYPLIFTVSTLRTALSGLRQELHPPDAAPPA
jgi:squalene-hopene/tetraprenyl-beta-curcumene cyclase